RVLPDRHSFPTRRSSDLCARAGAARSNKNKALASSTAEVSFPRRIERYLIKKTKITIFFSIRDPGLPSGPQSFPGLNILLILQQDRKSTRLNSSHVKNSY